MTLRLLLDEQISQQIQNELDRHTHTKRVVNIPSLGPGSADKDIWRYAVQNDYIVFSSDGDFVNGSADPSNGTHPGVIKCNSRHSQPVGAAVKNIGNSVSHREIVDQELELYVPGSWY